MKTFKTKVLELAKQVGDPKGKEFDTLDFISMELQVSIAEVKKVFKEKK
jgi:hypothetical protein